MVQIVFVRAGYVKFLAVFHAQQILPGEERLHAFDVRGVYQDGAMNADKTIILQFAGQDGDLPAHLVRDVTLMEKHVIALRFGDEDICRIDKKNSAVGFDGNPLSLP